MNKSKNKKWDKFEELKMTLANQVGGRDRFVSLFSKAQRNAIYNAILFERNIYKGVEDKKMISLFNAQLRS